MAVGKRHKKVTDASQQSIITDEVRAAIGSEVLGPPELVEMKAIRDYAIAISWPDPPNPLHVDNEYATSTRYGGIIAPWTFYTSLGRNVSPQRLQLPEPRVQVRGGNDYEYFRPIRPGDVVTATCKILGLSEREGRAGKLVFTLIEKSFINQRGELVGISRSTIINQY